MDEQAARTWIESLARTCGVQQIRPHGRPYLDRYYAAGWQPATRRAGPAIFLHHFLASDPDDAVHSHPWIWSASLIVCGGYRETRCKPGGGVDVREYRPGDVNVLAADDRHRIDLLAVDCWTVFLAGAFCQPWRFDPVCR
jgi:hypothetical protein